jgi:hypothetical protein
MKCIFYDEWFKKRVNKVINIFGKDWFVNKSILELGACHGDIGIEFLKLGADVTFSDARISSLQEIKDKINITPKTIVLDQNYPYNLDQKFDIVFHFGMLQYIEDWRMDLKCALEHTDKLILETFVHPVKGCEEFFIESENHHYSDTGSRNVRFTQETIEEALTELGCKFIRFDTNELNCDYNWLYDQSKIRHIYDWTYEKHSTGVYNDRKWVNGVYYETHFRRMWLIIK